jgi:hypothetical protein
MDRDALRRDLTLDQYWDSVVRRTPESRAAGVEPDDVTMIELLQALGAATPLFADPERAWHDLLQRPQVLEAMPSISQQPNHRLPGEPLADPVWLQVQPAQLRRGGALRLVATVLLLIATGLVAYFALGPGRPHPAVGPTVAPTVVSTPRAGVTVTPLGSGTVDALPDEPSWLMTFHSTFRPGGRYSMELSEGPDLLAVRSGAMTYHADRPITVIRAATGTGAPSKEVIPADTDAVLQAGDAAVIPMGANVSRRNDGTEPAVEIMSMVEGTFLGSRGRGAPSGVTDLPIVTFHISDAHVLPAAPATITLSQVTLAPGATLTSPVAAWWMIGTSEADYAHMEQQQDGTMVNIGSVPIDLYLTTLESLSGGTAVP